MTISELISFLREAIRQGEIDPAGRVYIYDCHDPEHDYIELDIDDMEIDDSDGSIIISTLNDPNYND
jgi:hypothetical protein